MELYSDKNCYHGKGNAQANLIGRTHYVDEDALRWHKSRIVYAYHHADGLLFSIVESVAADMHNTKRGFRYVIFDVFGNIIDRADLEHLWRTSAAAKKAMYKALDAIDAIVAASAAIDRAEKNYAWEIADSRKRLAELAAKKAA